MLSTNWKFIKLFYDLQMILGWAMMKETVVKGYILVKLVPKKKFVTMTLLYDELQVQALLTVMMLPSSGSPLVARQATQRKNYLMMNSLSSYICVTNYLWLTEGVLSLMHMLQPHKVKEDGKSKCETLSLSDDANNKWRCF